MSSSARLRSGSSKTAKLICWQFVAWIPLALFLVSRHGCEYREAGSEIADNTGTNRLVLMNLATRHLFSTVVEYDFDSLVWRTKEGETWTDHRVISKTAFQATHPTSRWVNEIDSIDSSKGTAIIKVGEESRPVTTGTGWVTTVQYSWREWDLNKNAEARLLRVCENPFEKYNEGSSSK
jgi:hypothetical protein